MLIRHWIDKHQIEIYMRNVMLVIHFIGLAMALGAGFSNIFLNVAASKLEPAERGSFLSKTSILGRMGQIGLGLLLLSGFSLATPYWKNIRRNAVVYRQTDSCSHAADIGFHCSPNCEKG